MSTIRQELVRGFDNKAEKALRGESSAEARIDGFFANRVRALRVLLSRTPGLDAPASGSIDLDRVLVDSNCRVTFEI